MKIFLQALSTKEFRFIQDIRRTKVKSSREHIKYHFAGFIGREINDTDVLVSE